MLTVLVYAAGLCQKVLSYGSFITQGSTATLQAHYEKANVYILKAGLRLTTIKD